MPLNNPNGGPQWTDEQCAVLTRLLASGTVYREIAKSINTQFGTEYSKNSVVGKVCRLGLTPPEKPKRPPYVRKASHKSRGIRAYVARRATHNSNAMRLFPVAAPDEPRCVEVKCETSFADVTGCRYTDGDGPFLFCNGQQRAGSSYCEAHFRLCRAEPRPRRDVAYIRSAA